MVCINFSVPFTFPRILLISFFLCVTENSIFAGLRKFTFGLFWYELEVYGLKKELENYPNSIGIFLETAHPIKFLDVVEPALNVKLPIPTQIESVLGKEKGLIFRNAGLTTKEFRDITVSDFGKALTLEEMAAADKRVAAYMRKQ